MPLQIAPIPYRGDQYLSQGISSAGNSIAEGIEGMTKRLRQTKAMRTMAVDGMGMDPDKVDNMSPEQIQGIMQGMAVKNAQKEAAARVQMEQAHADYYHRFNQKADREDQFSAAVSQYMQPQLMQPGEQGPPSTPKLDPQTLMMLEAKAGTLDPDKAMQYMKQLQGSSPTSTAFDEDPMTGSRFARLNNTLIPSGVDPGKVAAGPTMSSDDDFYFDGKKWVATRNRTMTETDRARLQGSHDKEIDGLLKALGGAKAYGDVSPETEALFNARMAHHQAAIDALAPQSPGAPGAKVITKALTAPMAMPTDKTKLVTGQVYQTPRGNAKWDGKQFVTQ